ncbi:MAG: DUF4157 domain-containing protein [Blastocatellales bacterium]
MTRRGEPLPIEVQQLLAPFFPGFDLSRIRVIEGIPRYVAITSKVEPLGYTDRWKIYFAPGAYRVDTAEGLALIAHEIEHCRQYQLHGKWRFRAKYLAAYFKNRRDGMPGKQAYYKIPFEIEAREVERKVYLALMRLQSEFLPIE